MVFSNYLYMVGLLSKNTKHTVIDAVNTLILSLSLLCHWFVRETRSFVHYAFDHLLVPSGLCHPSVLYMSLETVKTCVWTDFLQCCMKKESWGCGEWAKPTSSCFPTLQVAAVQTRALACSLKGCMDRQKNQFKTKFTERINKPCWQTGKECVSPHLVKNLSFSMRQTKRKLLSPGKTHTCLLTFFLQLSFMASLKAYKLVVLLLVLNFIAVTLKHKQK